MIVYMKLPLKSDVLTQAGTGAVGSSGCRLLQQYVDVSLLLGWLLVAGWFVGIWVLNQK